MRIDGIVRGYRQRLPDGDIKTLESCGWRQGQRRRRLAGGSLIVGNHRKFPSQWIAVILACCALAVNVINDLANGQLLERPEFIQWLPTVTDRGDEFAGFPALLATAKSLRAHLKDQN